MGVAGVGLDWVRCDLVSLLGCDGMGTGISADRCVCMSVGSGVGMGARKGRTHEHEHGHGHGHRVGWDGRWRQGRGLSWHLSHHPFVSGQAKRADGMRSRLSQRTRRLLPSYLHAQLLDTDACFVDVGVTARLTEEKLRKLLLRQHEMGHDAHGAR